MSKRDTNPPTPPLTELTEAEQIGANLKMAHRFSGCTFDDLMQASGLTRQALSNYEAGTRTPGSQTLLAYAEVTGFTVGSLLDRNHRIWESVRAILEHRDWLKEKRNRLASIDAALERAERNLEYVWSPDGDY